MPNPNPHEARIARRQARKDRLFDRGDIQSLQARLWEAIERITDLLDDDDADNDDLRRSANSLAQIATPFLKCIETGELEARLTAIEQQLKSQ